MCLGALYTWYFHDNNQEWDQPKDQILSSSKHTSYDSSIIQNNIFESLYDNLSSFVTHEVNLVKLSEYIMKNNYMYVAMKITNIYMNYHSKKRND